MRHRCCTQVGSLIVAIALGWIVGHVALAFGGPFAWIAFWLLGAMLCPLLVCLVTSRHRILNGALANLAMLAMPTLERLALGRVWPLPPDPNPPAVSALEILTLTNVWTS